MYVGKSLKRSFGFFSSGNSNEEGNNFFVTVREFAVQFPEIILEIRGQVYQVCGTRGLSVPSV